MFYNFSLTKQETIYLRDILDVYGNALMGNFKPLVESLDRISSAHVNLFNPNITNALFDIIREQVFGVKPEEPVCLQNELVDRTTEFAINKAKELWQFLIKAEFGYEISSTYPNAINENGEGNSKD